MIAFDPNNPYPLCSEEIIGHTDARAHAQEIDQWLGFKIHQVESLIKLESHQSEKSARIETWAHSDPQVFLTPYLELRYILEQIQPPPQSLILDCGAGYSRMAFVKENCFPKVRFQGIEYVSARVSETQRVFQKNHLANSKIKCGNLLDEDLLIDPAQFYLIYDFGTREQIDIFLLKLKTLNRDGLNYTLIARGLRTRACIEEQHRSWLFKVGPIWRDSEFSIYSTS